MTSFVYIIVKICCPSIFIACARLPGLGLKECHEAEEGVVLSIQ